MLSRHNRFTSIGCTLILGFLAANLSSAAQFKVVVHGTGMDLAETPLIVALQTQHPAGTYVLKPVGEGMAVPASVFVDNGKPYLGFVLNQIPRDATQAFILDTDDHQTSARRIQIEPKEGHLDILLEGKLFTRYIADIGPKPFLYPVIGPNDKPMTRAFPMENIEGETRDHPHQRSFWFTHGSVNGIDFWSELKGHGFIKETERVTVVGGPAVGLIRNRNHWLAPDGRKICEDERLLRVFATKSDRILDFDVSIRASEGEVVFGDTKEGTFGVRVASSMDVSRKLGGRITNADGLIDENAWGKPSAWVDYTGPVDGEVVGVAILNHPESFRYPTTWHVRTYGLFAANPFGWKDFGKSQTGEYTLAKGESVTFRYRIILHKGSVDPSRMQQAFRAYAHPPTVDIHMKN